MAFLVSGTGFLVVLALLIVDRITTVTVSEAAVSVIVVPTLIVLSLLALPGFYPYVRDASPRLGLAGLAAAILAGVSVTVVAVGKLVLHLLGIVGWTDEGPLLAGFFLWLIGFFLSLLCYGAASAWTGEPSRLIGVLMLFIILEPGSTLLNDLVGIDIGIAMAYGTLGLAGVAYLTIGYLLRTGSASSDYRESASGTVT